MSSYFEIITLDRAARVFFALMSCIGLVCIYAARFDPALMDRIGKALFGVMVGLPLTTPDAPKALRGPVFWLVFLPLLLTPIAAWIAYEVFIAGRWT